MKVAGCVARAAFLLATCTICGWTGARGEEPAAGSDNGGQEAGDGSKPAAAVAIEWRTPPDGFEAAARDKKPILVVWGGADAEAFWRSFDEEIGTARPFREKLADFVLVRVENPEDPAVTTALGHVDTKGVCLLLLDFRMHVQQRWNETRPSVSVLTRAMQKAAKSNAKLAQSFTQGEATAAKARYAAELKKYRDAVLMLLDGEKLALPADSAAAKALADVRGSLEGSLTAMLDDGVSLEDAGKYTEALAKYQEARREFPFPERVKEIETHIGRVMRKAGLGY